MFYSQLRLPRNGFQCKHQNFHWSMESHIWLFSFWNNRCMNCKIDKYTQRRVLSTVWLFKWVITVGCLLFVHVSTKSIPNARWSQFPIGVVNHAYKTISHYDNPLWYQFQCVYCNLLSFYCLSALKCLSKYLFGHLIEKLKQSTPWLFKIRWKAIWFSHIYEP